MPLILKKFSFLSYILFTIIISIFSVINSKFIYGLIFSIFISILKTILNKKLYFLLLIPIYLLHYKCFNNYINEFINLNKKILESIKIKGTVISKELNDDKTYKYKIKIYSVKINYIFKKIKNINIIIYSKENLKIFDFIKINKIIWYTQKNNNTFDKKNIKNSILIYGFGKNILIYDNSYKNIIKYIINKIYNFKEKINNKINENFKDNNKILFNSIFLGKTKDLNNKTKNLFSNLGIAHYLARSGLHINIINNFIMGILAILFVKYEISIYISLFFLLFFYAISFSSIPIQRAFIMWLIFCISNIIKINIDKINIFLICILLFIFINPISILTLSFQLSFFCTYILLLI